VKQGESCPIWGDLVLKHHRTCADPIPVVELPSGCPPGTTEGPLVRAATFVPALTGAPQIGRSERPRRGIGKRIGRKIGTATIAASIALGAIATSAIVATPAFASASSDLAAATNQARAAAGLPALQQTADLNAVAQRWAQHLAAANALSHNPALASQITNWTVLGENVGMAGDIPSVQKAFMASAHHRDNILDSRFTQMGVGSATSIYPSCGCQVIWVVVDFRRPETAATPAPAPAPAKPAPAPAKPAPAKPAPKAPVAHPATPNAPKQQTSKPAVTQAAPAAKQPAATPPSSVPTAPSSQSSAAALRTQLIATASASAGAAASSDPVSRLLSFTSGIAAG
jgi:uncharacterized protein YkwD